MLVSRSDDRQHMRVDGKMGESGVNPKWNLGNNSVDRANGAGRGNAKRAVVKKLKFFDPLFY